MPAVISPTTARLLQSLNPLVRRSYDIQAALQAAGKEVDRLDSAVVQVRRNFFANQAVELLPMYELLFALAVNPTGKTTAQRQNSVATFLQGLTNSGSGLDWESQLTRLIGTGWTYEEHQVGVGGSPPDYTVRITLPYAGPLTDPTDLSAAAVAGGGTFAAGTYHWVIAATNIYGETLPSPDASVAVAASGHADLTWTAVGRADGYSIYRKVGAVYQRVGTSATNAFTDTGAAPNPALVPATENSTKSVMANEAELLARVITPANLDLVFRYTDGFIVGISQIGEEPLGY